MELRTGKDGVEISLRRPTVIERAYTGFHVDTKAGKLFIFEKRHGDVHIFLDDEPIWTSGDELKPLCDLVSDG